ncbi:uncharacterized protein RHOBADRAFT_52653, partial [Rhodotorula graminis WP1]
GPSTSAPRLHRQHLPRPVVLVLVLAPAASPRLGRCHPLVPPQLRRPARPRQPRHGARLCPWRRPERQQWCGPVGRPAATRRARGRGLAADGRGQGRGHGAAHALQALISSWTSRRQRRAARETAGTRGRRSTPGAARAAHPPAQQHRNQPR